MRRGVTTTALAVLAVTTIALAGCGEHDGMWVDRAGVAPQELVSADSDGDGVIDEHDMCPGTPPGVTVDDRGCPLDDDKDGVPNHRDECPGTPYGVEVDDVGCPLDDDRDGVGNPTDLCPNTPYGMEVDDVGCSLEQALNRLGPVHFDLDKATLRPGDQDMLREVARVLKAHPNERVRIIGHTDSLDTWEYNMDLSSRRAHAVVRFLGQQGVNTTRLVPVGRGESEPVASNEDPRGRQENRRVVWRVITPGS